MVGRRSWRQLRARTALAWLAFYSLSACGGATVDDTPGRSEDDPSLAGSSSGGTGAVPPPAGGRPGTIPNNGGGVAAPAGGGSVVPPSGHAGCNSYDPERELFRDYVVDHDRPARRVLFSWTTPEQLEELRSGAPLLSRTERPGMGPGVAYQVLGALAAEASSTQQRELATLLSGEKFARARFAWPHAWATRMGWPGETYGNVLLRIELREEAWLVLLGNGDLSVIDMEGAAVPIADAISQPERITGFYFLNPATDGELICGGSFFSGGRGYREFIIANVGMVQSVEAGATDAIVAKLTSEIAMLERFLEAVQTCDRFYSFDSTWNPFVVCSWQYPDDLAGSVYHRSLAIPSEHYLPSPAHLSRMIETLRGDLSQPEPLVKNFDLVGD